MRAAFHDVADAFRRRRRRCLRRMLVTARYLRSLASAVGVGSRVHLCLEIKRVREGVSERPC